MIPLVKQLRDVIGSTTKPVLEASSKRSGVTRVSYFYWFKHGRSPRLDLFIAAVEAEGYELIMRKKPQTRIVTRNERIEAYRDNELIGYVENDMLFGIKSGYAEEIGPINHRVEIAGKLDAWRKSNGGG